MATRKSSKSSQTASVTFGSVFQGKHVVGNIKITVKPGKTLKEKDFDKLMHDERFNVTPITHNRVYEDAYVVRREMDGQLYLVQKWTGYICIFSNSQLKLMLLSANDKITAWRKAMIKAELVRRGALAKGQAYFGR